MENVSEFGSLDRFFAQRVLGESYSEEKAFFFSSLMKISRQGHLCWTPDPDLCRQALSFSSDIVETGCDGVLFPRAPVVRQGNRFYLQRNWVYETYLLREVKRLRSLRLPSFYDPEKFERELGKLVEQSKLLPAQAKVLKDAFENPFSLICGGPGTGKTYVSGFFIRLLAASLRKEEKRKIKISIAAPTGKAAAHLQSSLLKQGNLDPAIECEASTIHRLLGLRPEENRLFSGRKIDADLVIIDEASMLDVSLFAHLFEAIGNESRLVLIGDPNQLPPIETGSLFAEMTALFATPLQRSMRTKEGDLQAFAEAVNQGDSFEAERLLKEDRPSLVRLAWDFDDGFQEKIFREIQFYFSDSEPEPKALLKEMESFRILSSLRQGPLGIDALNRSIVQEMARRFKLKKPGQWWAIPIMAVANAPKLEIYNGSCGILIGKSEIELNKGSAFFPDSQGAVRLCKTPPPFVPAFCLSVHKSQGSEFEKVLALFPPGSENFGREAIYTAATRAKKRLELAITDEVLRNMLSRRSRKTSGFTERCIIPRQSSGELR